MSEFIVTEKGTGKEVYRYTSDQPVEWNDMEFATHDHTIAPVVSTDSGIGSAPADPAGWRIWVGSFFDRFGSEKLAILSSTDPAVQAVIKDASVRRYIDLLERRDELAQVIGLLNSKGFSIDPSAVLDVKPTAEEVWNG